MRFVPAYDPASLPPLPRSVRTPLRAGSVGTPATVSRFSFGPPEITVDRSRRGSHAGLPHVLIPVLEFGHEVATIDVHLHHNKSGLSVGYTVHHFGRSRARKP